MDSLKSLNKEDTAKRFLCNNGKVVQDLLNNESTDLKVKEYKEGEGIKEGEYEYVEEVELQEAHTKFLELLLNRLKQRTNKRLVDERSYKLRRPSVPFRLGGRLGKKRISIV